jgi:hypothetical protein
LEVKAVQTTITIKVLLDNSVAYMEVEKRITLLQVLAKHILNKTQLFTMLLLNQLLTLKEDTIHQVALVNPAI